MKAALIAIGTELLRFGHRDTNSPWLISQLERLGIDTISWVQVADEDVAIVAALQAASHSADVILTTGGLGPTEDDRSRQAIANWQGLSLVRDADHAEKLRLAFESRGYRFTANNARQADLPAGARWIENPVGSAWGIDLAVDSCRLFALPGVPTEMKPMFLQFVGPILESFPRPARHGHHFRIAGWAESALDRKLDDLHAMDHLDVTVLSGAEGVQVKLRAAHVSADASQQIIQTAVALIRERFSDSIYEEGDRTLAAVVGERLVQQGKCVAVAESCTGGLLGAALTEVAGASAWFHGGLLVYTNELKHRLAGVPERLLERHGAVSRPVVCALAEGVRERCGTDIGIGISGVAGPSGGTESKPVGTVHWALAHSEGVLHWQRRFPGDRTLIRRATVRYALDGLRRHLLDLPPLGAS